MNINFLNRSLMSPRTQDQLVLELYFPILPQKSYKNHKANNTSPNSAKGRIAINPIRRSFIMDLLISTWKI